MGAAFQWGVKLDNDEIETLHRSIVTALVSPLNSWKFVRIDLESESLSKSGSHLAKATALSPKQ